MESSQTCPDCGRPIPPNAPAGCCPRCLFSGAAGKSAIRRFGQYELLARIGEGGMGVVYRARQAGLDREVALKTVRGGALADGRAHERFQYEASLAARLDHPHIVPIFDVGELDGQPFFAMKFIEGGSLAETSIRARLSRSVPAVVDLMTKVTRAIAYAHQRGVLHRDLKPGNILVDAMGSPYVADFGLAKLLDPDSTTSRTAPGLGTLAYMPPEQADSEPRQLTTAADIYSLGAVLYDLLAGRPPFAGGSLEILRQLKDEVPAGLRSQNPQVDLDLETICLKCLERDPVRRYASAEELARELERWRRGEPIDARRSGPIERSIRWAQRKPALATLSLVAVALFIAGATGIGWQWRETRALNRRLLRERAEVHFDRGDTGSALASLAQAMQSRVADAAAERILYALAQRWQAVPVSLPMETSAAILNLLPGTRSGTALALTDDGVIMVYNHSTALSVAMEMGGRPDVADFSPDHRFCVFAFSNRVSMADLLTKQVNVPRVLPHRVRSLRFNPGNSQCLVVAGNQLQLVTHTDSNVVWSARAPGEIVVDARFSPDGRFLVTGSDDGTVALWDAIKGAVIHSLPAGAQVRRVAFSPRGLRWAAAADDGVVISGDTSTNSPLANVLSSGAFVALEFLNDRQLVAATGMNELLLLDSQSGQLLAPARKFSTPIVEVRTDPRRERLLVVTHDGLLHLLSAANGRSLCSLSSPRGAIRQAMFSLDGQFVIAGGESELQFWLLAAPFLAASPTNMPASIVSAITPPSWVRHKGRIVMASSSPDGRLIATASADHTARLWDAAAGRPATAAMIHAATVNAVGFSPDGRRLVTSTADPDSSVRVWDVASGLPLSDAIPAGTAIHSARFSAEGRAIAVSRDDQDDLIWPVATLDGPAPAWLAELAEAVGGLRQDGDGVAQLVTPGEFPALRSRLLRSEPGLTNAPWALEFLRRTPP